MQHCACGSRLDLDPTHSLHCILFRNQWVERRHTSLVKIIIAWIHKVFGIAYEPVDLGEKHQRPDIEAILDKLRLLIDVAIVNTKHGHAAANPSYHEDRMAADKIEKYQALAKQRSATVVPFVLNVYGGWHGAAVQLVKDINRVNNEDETLIPAHDLFYYFSSQIAIALQAGNAKAVMSCYQEAMLAQVGPSRPSPRLDNLQAPLGSQSQAS